MNFIKVISFFLLTSTACLGAQDDVLKQLKLPKGFSISIFADNVPNARTLAVSDSGVVYVGTRSEGVVYAIKDNDGDGVADKQYIIARNLFMPNGVAFNEGDLFVAETNRIIRFKNIEQHLNNPPKPEIIYDKFPSNKSHGWKYLRFGQDGKLYTSVGAPCNICEPKKEIYTSLVRMNKKGGEFEILARGIRNSVGFDWNPCSGYLFFTDNGRDNLGDDIPPEELNVWLKKGQHFGYPYCHAGSIPDPTLAKGRKCDEFVAPAWTFKAHMAPLGIRFYTGKQFPVYYKDNLFVALHGSWNRTQPHGYKIVLVKFKQGKPVAEEDFITGWLTEDGSVLGRPTDILQMKDGSLLITDDTLGVIYRVVYIG